MWASPELWASPLPPVPNVPCGVESFIEVWFKNWFNAIVPNVPCGVESYPGKTP